MDQKEKFYRNNQEYPCTALYQETEEACSDHYLDFLFELAKSRKAHDIYPQRHISDDLYTKPTIHDSPLREDRYKYTY
jgi:hypothetical protein